MFPSFQIFWQTIYLQWIWIILSTVMFIYWIYRYSNKFNLKFVHFLNFLPFFIIVPYFLWRYTYDLIEYKFFLPQDILNLLNPFDYRFSFIWVSFGIFFMMFMFIISLEYIQERKKRIDVFFYSINLSLVVIWPFLLLWDTFFWKITNSIFWISPLTTNTQIPFPTDKLRPIGIFVSFLWLFFYLLSKIIYFILKKPWNSIYLFPFLFIWFAIIFRFQHYPKHFLFNIDIKILYSYIMSLSSGIILHLITINKKLNRK